MNHIFWFLLVLPSSLCLSHEPPPLSVSSRSNREDPQELWLNVRLNQFDASNTDTFPMRFYYNGEHGGQHVVIVVGGEWSIHPSWTQAGLGYELAEAVGAGVFYTEHRYYGNTRPTPDTRVEDLRFLTVNQALADLAQFIQYVKSDAFENGRYKEGKVVLVGCSYAGSMATWMRLAYPHLVDAAFSDSGPLHAQEDFPEYLEVIGDALRDQGGASCVTAVEESMQHLTEMMNTTEGLATVSQLFNTCANLQSSPLDLASFFWFGITETFAYLVQYARPGDIPAACAVLTDDSLEPVPRLARWITSQPWTQPCIEARYSEQLTAHTNTSYDAPQTTMRLWTYQTCVEYGWYQTTTSSRQPFLSTVPLDYFHQMCRDFFGNNFNEEFLRSGIERTNLFFGGLDHMPDHVVSVAGGHDPWSPMGPNESHGHDLSPVYVVSQASHCRAVRSSLETENEEELRAVQVSVLSFLTQRVDGFPMFEPSSASRAFISTVLMITALFAAM